MAVLSWVDNSEKTLSYRLSFSTQVIFWTRSGILTETEFKREATKLGSKFLGSVPACMIVGKTTRSKNGRAPNFLARGLSVDTSYKREKKINKESSKCCGSISVGRVLRLRYFRRHFRDWRNLTGGIHYSYQKMVIKYQNKFIRK